MDDRTRATGGNHSTSEQGPQANWLLGAVAGALLLALPACGDGDTKDTGTVLPDGGSSETDDGSVPSQTPLYAIASAVYDADYQATTYVSLVESLEGQTLDFAQSREFGGQADLWLHEGSLFVTNAEEQTITKFKVANNQLVQEGAPLGFGNYGFSSFGFWLNVFVSADKAYMLNPDLEYVMWNPAAMEITGSVPLEGFETMGELKPYPGYTDRSAVVQDGLIYQPVYWADETYFKYTANSIIVVFDTNTNTVVNKLDAGCPGLDHATQDEVGNIYFSSWIFAPGGSALLNQPSTCVVKVLPGPSPTVAPFFTIKSVTDGREGGVFRYLGDGRAMMSVLHVDNAPGVQDTAAVAYGPNWRFWSYDLSAGTATLIDAFDWNAGAAYAVTDGSKNYMLVPAGDYKSTTFLELNADGSPTKVLTSNGWSTRMHRVR